MFGPRRAASAGHAQPLLRAESRPTAQIAPRSSVGIALGEIAKLEGETCPFSKIDKSSRGDSPSGSDDDNVGTSTDEETNRAKKRCSKKHKKKKHCQWSSSPSKAIKPIPPKEYDGSVDLRAYYCFIREGEAYLQDGKVHQE